MESSSDSSKVDIMIEEGIKSKKIEALLAQKINKISKVYNKEIITMINVPGDLKNLKNSKVRAQNLATYAYALIERLLLDLWNMKDIDLVLNCIREISTLKNSYEEFDIDFDTKKQFINYKVFYKLISQPFYHSRTLLGISLSMEILKIAYGVNEKLDISLEKIGYNNEKFNITEEIFKSNSSHNKKISKEYNFKFSSKKDAKTNYSLKINNKQKGGQFGAICTVSDGRTHKSFYVKTYYGYPAKANLNSEAAINASITLKTSSDIIGDSYPETEYSQVDFKELFVYKVLELIELGPKIHFIINPYLKDGILLVTENLNDPENKFIEMAKTTEIAFIGVQSKLNEIRLGKYNDKEYQSYNALIDLLEIDTVNRIFTLNDFNTDNFGYLIKKEENVVVDEENFAENWLSNHHDFKIIDFISSIKKSDKYIEKEIVHSFLEGNSTTKHFNGSIMYVAICRTIEQSKIKANKIDERKKKNKQEKLYFGKKVIERLEMRFKNNLKNILQNSQKEVKNFIQKNKESIVLTEEYIEEGFKDIDNYINGIVTNYETLKNYIINN